MRGLTQRKRRRRRKRRKTGGQEGGLTQSTRGPEKDRSGREGWVGRGRDWLGRVGRVGRGKSVVGEGGGGGGGYVNWGVLNPASLDIVIHPSDVLRRKCEPVVLGAGGAVSAETQAIVARMVEVMRQEEGIGLAAPQIGVSQRIFVVDVPEDEGDEEAGDPPRLATSVPPEASTGLEVYINPVISQPGKKAEPFEEGCLSLPKIRGRVIRPTEVTISAIGLDGKAFTKRGAGLLARCWQHEFDHLEGVLIIDRMLQADRIKNRKKLRELEADGDEGAGRG